MKQDKVTQDRINKLHPIWREKVREAVAEANANLADNNVEVRIVQGLRTFTEQDDLYAQGRTKPGPRVTKAKAGQSLHNYGLAIDFCLLIGKKTISWDTKKDFDNDKQADWIEVVRAFTKRGFLWGASFGDYPHIGAVKESMWKELLPKHKANQFLPGTTYVDLYPA